MKISDFFLIAALLAVTAPALARIKYVAVVETELDAQSGAPDDLSAAEVRQITAELRREAVKSLPGDKYSIITSETVQAQGGAVLEECADENCVIILGSKIGADYIARGIVSKFKSMLTLQVEMYDTENGTLIASSAPVRSENAAELLESAAPACMDMYKTFLESQKPEKDGPAPETEAPEPPKKPRMTISGGGGAFFACDFGGGLRWDGGEQLTMPYYGGGAYLFIDMTYMEAFAGYSGGTGKWRSASASNPADLPDMRRSYVNIGMFLKYPFNVRNLTVFPLFGVDGGLSASGKLIYGDKEEKTLNRATTAAWTMFGAGVDCDRGGRTYWRAELTYGWRMANKYEEKARSEAESVSNPQGVETKLGHGLSLKAGLGVRLF